MSVRLDKEFQTLEMKGRKSRTDHIGLVPLRKIVKTISRKYRKK